MEKEREELVNVKLGEDGMSVVILDQTLLPNRVEYLTLRTLEELVDAHRTLYRMLQDRNLDHLEEKINGTYFLEVGLGAADRVEP